MTDLQRFVTHLAQTAAARDPALLDGPLPLTDLLERVLPYRACRRALDLTTVEEYELLVLRLLAEEGGFGRTHPPEAADRCRAELSAIDPDLGVLRAFPDVAIVVWPGMGAGAEAVRAGRPDPGSPAPAGAPVPAPSPPPPSGAEPAATATPLPAEPPEVSMPTESAVAPANCPHCAATLPRGREIRFCPHCGGNVRTRRCPACATELELAWRHCVMCGHAVGDAPRVA